MAAKNTKPRPDNVPEENVYMKTHWTIIVALIAVILTGYVVVSAS